MEFVGLEDLEDALRTILSKVGPTDAARVACVSKRLKAFASDESLWSRFFNEDLQLSTPVDLHGNSTASFMVAYRFWREAFGMYPWALVKRGKRCWDNLKTWLSINYPEVNATLRRGVSEDDIQELENELNVKLPLPTRILYRFCDGQGFTDRDFLSTGGGSSLGLIGGYSFYSHVVNVYLLPLKQVIMETKEIVRHLGVSGNSKFIVVAVSLTFSEKLFFLDCASGQLYVGTRNLAANGEMIQCVPNAMIKSVHDFNGDQQQDAMLLWLEEHARRLQNGIIKVNGEGVAKSINLFPEAYPHCSTAVTNGVKVRASAVFVPELADLQSESDKYWFAYSIRMSLLPEGCIINGICFSSCQLHMRHWIIRSNDAIVSDVNGEAVIGMFPLLHPGEEEFVYESCTPIKSSSGSVEGSFTFVPGSLADQRGSPFKVQVARFPLELPDYVF